MRLFFQCFFWTTQNFCFLEMNIQPPTTGKILAPTLESPAETSFPKRFAFDDSKTRDFKFQWFDLASLFLVQNWWFPMWTITSCQLLKSPLREISCSGAGNSEQAGGKSLRQKTIPTYRGFSSTKLLFSARSWPFFHDLSCLWSISLWDGLKRESANWMRFLGLKPIVLSDSFPGRHIWVWINLDDSDWIHILRWVNGYDCCL